jgi:hypothetical protein
MAQAPGQSREANSTANLQTWRSPATATKIFIVGIIAAAILAGLGAMINAADKENYRDALPTYQEKVKTLTTACEAEAEARTEAARLKEAANPGHYYLNAHSTMLCDPRRLTDGAGGPGVQEELGRAEVALETAIAGIDGPGRLWPYGAALIILVISVLPAGWYFLLRRVSELRQAIVGK